MHSLSLLDRDTEKNITSKSSRRQQSLLAAKAEPDDFQNVMASSLSRDTSLLKLSWSSDQQFSREVANKKLNRQTNNAGFDGVNHRSINSTRCRTSLVVLGTGTGTCNKVLVPKKKIFLCCWDAAVVATSQLKIKKIRLWLISPHFVFEVHWF